MRGLSVLGRRRNGQRLWSRARAKEPTCSAPFAAFRLDPLGDVKACGVNWTYDLGNVADQTLAEIWHGEPIRALRDALARGDYSLGCQTCGRLRQEGKRQASHAAAYDELGTEPKAAMPKRIEFALSNTCNLQCVMCNGDLSSAIRSQREGRPPLESPYGERFFAELPDILPHLEYVDFIGGEPFLARECRRVWDLMIDVGATAKVHVTTNGTIWNDRVDHYLRALKMDVSLSQDGVTPDTNDRIRIGSDLTEMRANRVHIVEALRSYGGELIMNFCVMRSNYREFLPFLLEAEQLGAIGYHARVERPEELSLFSLPPSELRRVIDEMSAQGEAHLTELQINRHVFTDTLDELRFHLSDIEGEEQHVVLGRPRA